MSLYSWFLLLLLPFRILLPHLQSWLEHRIIWGSWSVFFFFFKHLEPDISSACPQECRVTGTQTCYDHGARGPSILQGRDSPQSTTPPEFDTTSPGSISTSAFLPSWGAQMSNSAAEGMRRELNWGQSENGPQSGAGEEMKSRKILGEVSPAGLQSETGRLLA